MLEQASIDSNNIICPFCGHQEGLLLEVDSGDWVVQCVGCGAIGPGQASSPQLALQWFRPTRTISNIDTTTLEALSGEQLRHEDEMMRFRIMVAHMLDYLPRGSALYHQALRALI